jgi:hypothetical protein
MARLRLSATDPTPPLRDTRQRDNSIGPSSSTAASRHKEQRGSRWIDPMQDRSVAWWLLHKGGSVRRD